MTFKTPSPAVYFGSLLIAALLAAIVYWILQAQDLAGNGMPALVAGLFIGHLLGVSTQPSMPQKPRTRTARSTTAPAAQPGETISLYVGNLAYRAQRDELYALFAQYGEVESVRIMTDRITRRPRGFGFVEMEGNAAREALSQLDNTEFCGRNLRVSEAKQRPA